MRADYQISPDGDDYLTLPDGDGSRLYGQRYFSDVNKQ